MIAPVLALLLQAAPGIAAEEKFIRVRIDVAPTGRVSGCEVLESDAPQNVQTATCDTMKARGRYKAAMKDGKAVASTKELRVRWRPTAPVTPVASNAKAPIGR